MISSLGYLYGRGVYLHIVAGGLKNDLVALNEPTPHDERYARAVEYTRIVKALLATEDPVSFSGKYYGLKNLHLTPPLPSELFPGILISGSSDAGLAAGRQWHKELSNLGEQTKGGRSPYWLRPFESYETSCPYRLWSYDVDEIARNLDVGFMTFILDLPPSEEELRHTAAVFKRARRRADVGEPSP